MNSPHLSSPPRKLKTESQGIQVQTAWIAAVTTCFASSFFILGSISLTKIGFLLLLAGFPMAKGRRLLTYPKSNKNERLLVAFVVFSGLTLFYAADRTVGLAHYVSLVSCLVIYCIARSLLTLHRITQRFLIGIVAAALVSSFFGILQVTTGHFFVPGTEARSIITGDSFRANGLFDDPNYFGYLLCIAWPIAALMLREHTKWQYTVCSVLVASAMLTFSRATMIIVALQFFILSLFFSPNPSKVLFRLAAMITVVLPSIVIINPFGVMDRLLTLLPVFLEVDSSIDNSTAERLDLLAAGIKMFFDHPWFGVGFGNFQVMSAEYMDFFPRSVYAHNTYITVATESGVIGISLYLGFLFTLCRRLLRNGYQFLFISLVGLMASNFFLVAHYFPITYLYFAALLAYNGPRDQHA